MGYLYIGIMIVFTVYGQLILKMAVNQIGPFPGTLGGLPGYLAKCYTNIWIISGLFAAFFASGAWMLAVSKMELSRAYPFTTVQFILVIFLSTILFQEQLNMHKIVGVCCIVAGLLFIAKGY